MAGRQARSAVFAPDVPAIHVFDLTKDFKTWMPAAAAGMMTTLWHV